MLWSRSSPLYKVNNCAFHQPEKPESRLISKQGNAVEAAPVQVDPVRVLCSLLRAPLHPGEQEEDGGVGDDVGDDDEEDVVDEGGEIGWLSWENKYD